MPEPLLQIFKALADPVRLRLIALILDEERCGQELATELTLAPATVSHHLRRLRAAGLVTERAEPPYVYYRLDHASLRKAVLSITDKKKVSRLATAGGDAYAAKVIDTFFEDGRLTAIPTQRRKKEVVFEEILRRLPRRDVYTERELSNLIAKHADDYCTIRREFIMGRYMTRDRGRYRLAPRGHAIVDSTET
jgi:biotin operon repressor